MVAWLLIVALCRVMTVAGMIFNHQNSVNLTGGLPLPGRL
jgi:hypothetical protein